MVGMYSKYSKSISVLFLFFTTLIPGVAYSDDMRHHSLECYEELRLECIEVVFPITGEKVTFCDWVSRTVCS